MSGLPVLESYNEFVSNLTLIDDEEMRFEYIIDVGKSSNNTEFPEEKKVDENLMHGCMSKVWIFDQVKDGRHYFTGFSDAIIVAGLVVMMTRSFSGLTSDEYRGVSKSVVKVNIGANHFNRAFKTILSNTIVDFLFFESLVSQ